LLLSSATYFIFLAAVFFLYWPVSRVRSLALGVILFANYFFYAKWDLVYLAIIPAASTLDYLFGLGLMAFQRAWLRRILVGASLLMNLGLLVVTKYVPFILTNWANLTHKEVPEWHWFLPVTLSFYVFQALTYTLDLYRRDAKGTRSYLAHLAAVSFFPTTLAGPITRVSTLIDQFDKPKKLEPADGGRALFLIGMGLTKKLLVADYLSANLVNRVFDFPALYSGFEVLIAVYAYALQIYFDFSGYTDIAIGSALLVGIKLPPNFNMPYAAVSIADFWRRWHITFSNWLRDYLYFSLPGLRSKLKIFVYFNLFLTMVIGGLWHGASWTFVIWGAIHGTGLAIHRVWLVWRNRKAAGWRKYLGIFATTQFVCFAWIFFRASSWENAIAMLQRIGSLSFSAANLTPPLWLILGIAVAGHYLPRRWYDFSLNLYARAPFFVQAALLAALVVGLQYVAQTGATPFIYNKF
jgi:D-alanyl-lipoteichoic acid acyltransferase DltB (MBOAT superfamily)